MFFKNSDFSPFENRTSFELADLLFHREQMSGGNINDLLQIWASTLSSDQDPPFNNKQDMYTPLMRSLRAMRDGRIFPSHSTVKYLSGIPLPGSMRSMMSISAIHALCCTINLEILTLQMRKIMLPRRSVTRTISVDTGTSCLVIGYGGSRYVLVKM